MTKHSLSLACLLVGIGIGWIANPSPLEEVAPPLEAKPSAGNSHPKRVTAAESQEEQTTSSRTRSSSDESRRETAAEAIKDEARNRKFGADQVMYRKGLKFEKLLAKRSSELNLTPEQQAKLRAMMEEHFSKMSEVFVSTTFDSMEKTNEYTALINGTGVDQFVATLLTDEQKSAFDSIKAKERKGRIESKALVQLGNLSTVLDLTQEKSDAVHAVLFEIAAKQEDASTSRSLNGNFIELSGIDGQDELGILSIIEEYGYHHKYAPPADDYKKFMTEIINKRIPERVEECARFSARNNFNNTARISKTRLRTSWIIMALMSTLNPNDPVAHDRR